MALCCSLALKRDFDQISRSAGHGVFEHGDHQTAGSPGQRVERGPPGKAARAVLVGVVPVNHMMHAVTFRKAAGIALPHQHFRILRIERQTGIDTGMNEDAMTIDVQTRQALDPGKVIVERNSRAPMEASV